MTTKRITVESLDRLARRREQLQLDVLPEYEDELRDFYAGYVRHGRRFLLSIAVLLVLLFVAVALRRVVLAGGLAAAVGMTVAVFPYMTPETARQLGLANAIRTTRLVGAAVALAGAAFAFAGLSMTG